MVVSFWSHWKIFSRDRDWSEGAGAAEETAREMATVPIVVLGVKKIFWRSRGREGTSVIGCAPAHPVSLRWVEL